MIFEKIDPSLSIIDLILKGTANGGERGPLTLEETHVFFYIPWIFMMRLKNVTGCSQPLM